MAVPKRVRTFAVITKTCHHDTAGHSVKCSPTAGTFRLHR
nr:MAG TPA: hypothetical protein [Caudoviricetes sp.]